jgi:hypothetical protein
VWVFADELDLAGAMAVELDVWKRNTDRLRISVDTVTAIEKSLGDFTFSVRDVQLDGSVAWRRQARGGIWSVAAGRRELWAADRDGRRGFTYLAGGWESEAWAAPVPPPGLAFRLDAGAAFDATGVAADAMGGVSARWTWAFPSLSAGIEASLDTLWDGGSARSDLWIGPRLDLRAGEHQGLTLFARWFRGRHPLGLGLDGILAGFEIVESPTAFDTEPNSTDVLGKVAAGVDSDGRGAGRILLRVASPQFHRGLRVSVEVDANVLDTKEAGELWYRYDLGIDRALPVGRLGGWFFHRSNHLLSSENPIGVTSVNVLEVGHESERWERVPEVSSSSWGRLDWRARGGWILDSSFEEDRPWHVRGGLRWSWRRPGRSWTPFLTAEIEQGNVGARRFAFGTLHVSNAWEGSLAWIREEQWFREDKSSWIVSVAAHY